jgi:hypothetical protein
VNSCSIRQETEHTSSLKGAELEYPPVFSHASSQAAATHSSLRSCGGNAFLQLRWHR